MIVGRAILATAFAAISAPAFAQQQICADRSVIVADLAEKYQERQVSQGITSGGNLFEIYASLHGSWTLVVTLPDSLLACIVEVGTGWDKPPGKEA